MSQSTADSQPVDSSLHRPAGIQLRGVRVHNLRQVDLDIPLRTLTVVAGPAASGRHSLVFDTLHAESQRRYIESFSLGQQALFDQLERPDADSIRHLPPSIALQDLRLSAGLTLGQVAGFEPILAGLWSKWAALPCPTCDRLLTRWTTERLREAALGLPSGCRVMVTAPVDRTLWQGDEGAARWLSRGFVRAIVNGQVRELRTLAATVTPCAAASADGAHDPLIVVDRLVAGRTPSERWDESLTMGEREGGDRVTVLAEQQESLGGLWNAAAQLDIDGRGWRSLTAARSLFCDHCKRTWPALRPEHFLLDADTLQPALLQPRQNHAEPTEAERWMAAYRQATLRASIAGVSYQTLIADSVETGLRHWANLKPSLPAAGIPLWTAGLKRLTRLRQLHLQRFRLQEPWEQLSRASQRRVQLVDVIENGVVGTLILIDDLLSGVPLAERAAVISVGRELVNRRNTVVTTDESPTSGSSDWPAACDWLIELGPGAGANGGQVLFSGVPSDRPAVPHPGASAVSAQNTAQNSFIPEGERRNATLTWWNTSLPAFAQPPGIEVTTTWPLAEWSAEFSASLDAARVWQIPRGAITVIQGPTGSGKTTLLRRWAAAGQWQRLTRGRQPGGVADETESGLSRPLPRDGIWLGRSAAPSKSRTILAQWLGVWTDLREVFAETPLAREKGWTPTVFSFNSAAGGRCRRCQGRGELQVKVDLLPMARAVCPDCQGQRYRRDVLEARYRGKSIGDVLQMTLEQGADHFRSRTRIQSSLAWIRRCGLGSLSLGHPMSQLAPGSVQRLNVAAIGNKPLAGPTLIACDEPCAGLSWSDVAAVFGCYRELTEIGHTVVVADEHPHAAALADFRIML